ncbi:GerAB/ArcD/ProY family transporter [Desulforamulus hydrothermalis]|uniref:Spore germination protein n=1 Tax=Desulforamulus hydrothermalis Lam5 = DSM 18033 TaxID=1121428 RepID=K8EAB9_9FIRM|nr:endospore germination permease [Desulforamulus hydrothermalis]CCO08553.1 Spore germination protein [Desulforamulus hydrothermalis Lam5 = DSM 18033]SHH02330.1 spore germination protein KB [Desulforamulus hydrothermalis Lam5 = DSM 18033]
MSKAYISPQQLFLLLLGFVVGTALFLVPSSAIGQAGQDAWLAPFIALPPGLLLLALLLVLNKMYPGRSIVQYSQSILGWPGKAVGLLVIWFALHLGALVLRNIVSFIDVIFLVGTPSAVLCTTITLLAAYAVRLGIEVMARALGIALVLATVFFAILQGTAMLFAQFDNLLPVLEKGWLPVLRAAVGIASFPGGEILVFGMVIYHLKPGRGAAWYPLAGLAAGLFMLFLSIERSVTVLGPAVAARAIYTPLVTINSIPGGQILVTLMAVIWYFFSIFKFIICYYAFVQGVAHWTGARDYRPLVLPAGALLAVFSLFVYKSAIDELFFAQTVWPVYAIPLEYGIPLLLWLAALLRKALGVNKNSAAADTENNSRL